MNIDPSYVQYTWLPYYINDNNCIIGNIYDINYNSQKIPMLLDEKPVYWNDFSANPVILNNFNENSNIIKSINDNGNMVGCYIYDISSSIALPLYWNSYDSSAIILDMSKNMFESYYTGFANCIDNSGHIVGVVTDVSGSGFISYPAYWNSYDSSINILSLYDGSNNYYGGFAFNINNNHQIVGSIFDSEIEFLTYPAYWSSYDSNVKKMSLYDGSNNYYGGLAYDINENGNIVGFVTNMDPSLPFIPAYWSDVSSNVKLLDLHKNDNQNYFYFPFDFNSINQNIFYGDNLKQILFFNPIVINNNNIIASTVYDPSGTNNIYIPILDSISYASILPAYWPSYDASINILKLYGDNISSYYNGSIYDINDNNYITGTIIGPIDISSNLISDDFFSLSFPVYWSNLDESANILDFNYNITVSNNINNINNIAFSSNPSTLLLNYCYYWLGPIESDPDIFPIIKPILQSIYFDISDNIESILQNNNNNNNTKNLINYYQALLINNDNHIIGNSYIIGEYLTSFDVPLYWSNFQENCTLIKGNIDKLRNTPLEYVLSYINDNNKLVGFEKFPLFVNNKIFLSEPLYWDTYNDDAHILSLYKDGSNNYMFYPLFFRGLIQSSSIFYFLYNNEIINKSIFIDNSDNIISTLIDISGNFDIEKGLNNDFNIVPVYWSSIYSNPKVLNMNTNKNSYVTGFVTGINPKTGYIYGYLSSLIIEELILFGGRPVFWPSVDSNPIELDVNQNNIIKISLDLNNVKATSINNKGNITGRLERLSIYWESFTDDPIFLNNGYLLSNIVGIN